MRIEAEGGGWHADAVGAGSIGVASDQHGGREHSSGNSIRSIGGFGQLAAAHGAARPHEHEARRVATGTAVPAPSPSSFDFGSSY